MGKPVKNVQALHFNSLSDFLKSPEYRNEILPALLKKIKAEKQAAKPSLLDKAKALFK